MPFKKLLMLLLVAAFAVAGFSPATAQNATLDMPAVLAFVESVMQEYSVPGLGLAIVQNGEIIYTGGLGYRDAAKNAPVEAGTAFHIASVTKSFTGVAVMTLVQEGKIDLDAPVITYLPDLRFATEAATNTITVRHLLTHTSGLAPGDDLWFKGKPPSRAELIAETSKIEITAAPGERYEYVNHNFILAGQVIEAVSGQSYEDFMIERVLRPLGMERASFSLEGQDSAALAHQLMVLDGPRPVPTFPRMDLIAATGGLVASPQDMAQYILYQIGDGAPLLSPELFAQTHAPAIQIGGEASYALGWNVEPVDGVPMLQHNGLIDGYYSELAVFPQLRSGYVLMVNEHGLGQGAVSVLGPYLTNALFGAEANPSIAEEKAKEYHLQAYWEARQRAANYSGGEDFSVLAGRYETAIGPMEVELRGQEVWVTGLQDDGAAIQLIPFDSYAFLPNGSFAPNRIISFDVSAPDRVKVFFDGEEAGQRIP